MPRSVTTLVGRAVELAALTSAVQQAEDGVASVVVLDGDAGVGKTRLLSELVRHARSRDALCLIGHCVDLGDAPPPYLPFTEAFARLAAQRPELVDGLRAAYPALARLLPRVNDLPAGPDDRVDRGELFEAVVGAIAQLASTRQVLFVVEDLHWADQATRDLLGFLFTRLGGERVALVCSFRSDDLHRRHPLRPTLAQWARLPAVARVHLGPLDASDVRTLVRELHPGAMAEPEVHSIITRADGNAFFAEELVAAAGQYGDPQQLPWQLADVLLVRLDRVSEAGREVVRVAAVGGRRISHELLASVVQLPPPELDAALRDAVDAHILQPTPSGRGYTFRHALLAEAVYDDLLPGERVRIHAGYAEALAKSDGRSAAELARHARASHDLETAYDASVRAGHEAMAVAAPQEAMNHYQAALELAPMVRAADGDPAPLVLAVVDAAVAAGRSYRGLRLAREALAALADDAPPLTRARLLFAFASAAVAGETDDEPLKATAEALRLVPADEPTAFRARLAALHARCAFAFGREVDAERWAREAVATAAALNNPRASADAETTRAMLERRAVEPDQAAARLIDIAESLRESGDVPAELRARYNLGSLYYETTELERSQSAYEATCARAIDVGRPWAAFAMEARAMVGLLQYVRGDWDGALHTLDITGQTATAQAEALYAATAMLVRAGRGVPDTLDMIDTLRPWWERESRVALYSVSAALEVYEADGSVDAAFDLLDDLVKFLSVIWQDPWFLAHVRLCAQGLAVLSGAVSHASQAQRQSLVERGASLVDTAQQSLAHGLPSGRKLGPEGAAWVARVEAEWLRLRWLAGVDTPAEDELVRAWQDSATAFGYGNVIEIARSRARLAAVLRAAGRAAEAAEQADLARDVARELRAAPLLAEIRALGTSASARTSAGAPTLTEREHEVLAQLVDGRTNRQIANLLYISEKTVSVHVSNILSKLGVRSRNEAAALARRQG